MDINEVTDRRLSRRRFLQGTALAGIGVAGGSFLAACGGGSSGSSSEKAVTWASWANPGEAQRFKQYSTEYAQANDIKVTYQTIVGDYQAKLLTQLAGGAAADCFYVGDSTMAKIIETKQIEDLTGYLNSSDSPIKTADVYEGLWQWCKGPDGKGIYGLPVDCNPKVFWFNKKLLSDAGVSQTPAQLFEAGTWNQSALTDLLTKVKSTGKRGMVFEANWFDLVSIVTTFGGTAFDDSGKAVFDTDPKAQAAIAWLFDQMNSGNISYGGSLPKGQGVDALFYGGQLATIHYGRWILPNLKQLKDPKQFDIAPMPSETGKDVAPVAVYTAAMSVYTKAKNKELSQKFFGDFVSKDGQQSRLSGGGNAVPSISGLDGIVTEGGLPEHGKWFTEIAAKGYAIPEAIGANAKVATGLPVYMDKLIKAKESAESFSQKTAAFINSGGA